MEIMESYKKETKFQKIGLFITSPKNISQMRALLYMYCSGPNQSTVNPEQFIAGINRFALDNPIPTITSRLAWYGNEENTTKSIFEWLEKRIKDIELFDKENFTN